MWADYPLFDDLDTLSTDSDFAQQFLQLESAEAVLAAYDMLTGESHVSLSGVLMEATHERRELLVQRAMQGQERNAETSYGLTFGELPKLGANWWSSGYGSYLDRDATSNSAVSAAALTSETSGFLIGVDASRDGFTFGIAGGQSVSDIDVDDRNSSTDVETWSLAAYAAYDLGVTTVSFGGMFDWHTIDADRRVEIGDFAEALSADYDATTWQVYLETDYDLSDVAGLGLKAFARLAHVSHESDGFVETSGGGSIGPVTDIEQSVALTAQDAKNATTYTTLGLRHARQVEDFHLKGSIAWRHAFGDIDPTVDMSLAGSAPFTITGSPVSEDAFVAHLSARVDLSDTIHLTATLAGEISDTSHAFGISAELAARF